MRRLLLLIGLLAIAAPVAAQPTPPSYGKHVQPFLTRYCVECHTAQEPEGGLNLESYRGLMAGGINGAAVIAGKPDEGRLVRMIEGKLKPVMPPRKAKQPSPAEVAVVRAWVAAGAVEDRVAGVRQLPTLRPRARVATPVTAVAWSPSGKVIAASGRGEVLLLDAATGEVRHRLPAGRDRVTAVAFSPRGEGLATAASTAGEGHEVRVWTMKDDAPQGAARVVARHDDVIQAVAFSPDSKVLASAGYDRLIRLTDPIGGKEWQVLKDHSDSVYAVSFSADGRLLASGGADRAVKVWEVATGTRLYTLGENTDWVYAVAFAPTGNTLAAAGVDRSIRVWQAGARQGTLLHATFAHDRPITRLVYSADARTLYSLSEDRTVKAWTTAGMSERQLAPPLPETPLALAVRPDEKEVAVGRFDGVLEVVSASDGKVVRSLLPIRPKPPAIGGFTPTEFVRGQTAEVRFTGKHLAGATVVSTVPDLTITPLASTDTTLTVRVQPPANTLPGKYTWRLRNDGGQSDPHVLLVDRFAVVKEVEGNASARTAQRIVLPATVAGEVGRAGDLDWFAFDASAGQEIGVEVLASTLGSPLRPVLTLIDLDGTTVAESTSGALGHTAARAGRYALGVRDAEYRGQAGMSYRLSVGPVPVVTSVFPTGLQQGTAADVRVRGVHLGGPHTVRVQAPPSATAGTRLPLTVPGQKEAPLGVPELVVGAFPEVIADPKSAILPTPGTANGVIGAPGAAQTWRVQARKGERLILEVNAARIGSPLDSTLEMLDDAGRPLPRALLRGLTRTYVAFRDHDARSPGIRLETWGDLAVNDYLLVGGELLRIRALPRNPDDDCRFFDEDNVRLGFLGTTPTHQPQSTPLYKVAILPPGTRVAPNGLPLVSVTWRNDDGPPSHGKDSRLAFDPPADGWYQVRVGDARGQGGPAYTYRLTARPPRPDFDVRLTVPASVNRGGAVPVRVNVRRTDEFDGTIDVKLTGLPAGFHAPATNLPGEDDSTAVALFADASAQAPTGRPTFEVEARAVIGGKEVVRRATGTLPRLIDPGDIVTTTEQTEATIHPGGETRVTVRVERRNGFKGRIPLDVQGLPHGVRVLDVGLNGILVTEAETTRTFALYCEPWVKPLEHPIVVVARQEGKGTEYAARSVLLRVAK